MTVNGSNTTFTVTDAGTYRIAYNACLTTSMLMSTRLVINGSGNTASTYTPMISTNQFEREIIVDLTAESTITLQFFGLLGAATLNGVTLSIIRLA